MSNQSPLPHDQRRRIVSDLSDDNCDDNRSLGETFERPYRGRVGPAQTRQAGAETNAQNEGKATHDVESIIAAEGAAASCVPSALRASVRAIRLNPAYP